MVKGFSCLLIAGVLCSTGCGDDSGDNAGAAGTPGWTAGTSGSTAGTSGSTAGTTAAGTGGSTAGTGGTGGTGGMDAGTGCTTAADCSDGQQCCSMACTDTETDHDHCGACGTKCEPTQMCSEGKCVAAVCSGEPGEPVDDDDAGVPEDDDAGVDAPVFGDNGCPPNETCIDDGSEKVCKCGDGDGCLYDETCSEDGDCLCGDAPGCTGGDSCCGEECVDLQNDDDNCGKCNRACTPESSCNSGTCTCANPAETACEDGCYNLQNDEQNCGECGERCPTGSTCVSGECRCNNANNEVCNGRCVAMGTDRNCTECGDRCESPSTCRDPSGSRPLGCYCPNVNEVPCDGVCVALGTTQNCGACGDVCDGPANVCRSGRCECPTAGQTECGNQCVNLNTGRDIDPTENVQITDCGGCGVTCLPGAACNNGQCACPGGSTIDRYCDENPITGVKDGVFACIDVNTTKNCGACGNACIDDSTCRGQNGSDDPEDFRCVCIGSDSGKTHCAGIGCRDLRTDEENCGTCGRACPANVTCRSGACDCPGGDTVSVCVIDGEPACVDLDNDEENCGTCGHACAAGEECCSGVCADPDTDYEEDRNNCGACGTVCGNDCGFWPFLRNCECNEGDCE